MKNKNGFTLTEILLAVMIVGVIGITLAALTTAAVREGGVGRTKAVLRGQLSLALRQLRQDILQSTAVTVTATGTGLTLQQDYSLGPDHNATSSITYEFTAGAIPGGGGGATGGKITRNGEVWLANVKQINDGVFYSPSFALETDTKDGGIESRLRVRIIVEIPSEPVVNEVVEETFVLPQGFAIQAVAK